MKWRVPTPDGKTIEFDSPDGTTKEEALSYAQEHYKPEPAPQEPFDLEKMAAKNRSDLVGHIGALGRGAVTSALGAPGEAANLLNKGINAAESVVGIQPAPYNSDLGSEAQVGRGIDKVVGDFGRPKNTADEYFYSIGEAAPYFVGGPASAATKIGGAVLSGVGSKAGGDLGEEVGGSTGKAVGSILGGAIGGGLAGKVEKALADSDTKGLLKAGDEIKAASKQGYNVLENNPALISPAGINNFHTTMDTYFNARWFSPVTAPATYQTMKDFEKARKKWTLGDVMGQYERLGRIVPGGTISAQDAEAARILRSEILDWLDTNVRGVKPQIKEALGNWSMHKKIEEMQKVIEVGRDRAAVSGTGANVQNTLRQELRKVLNNDKRLRGYPPEVVAKMEQAVSGSIMQNIARFGGRFAPTGLHSSAFTLALALHSAPMAVAGAATGYASKKLGDFLTHRQIEDIIVALEEHAPANAGAAARRQNVMSRVSGLPAQGAARGAVAGAQEQEQPPFIRDSQGGAYDALGNAQP